MEKRKDFDDLEGYLIRNSLIELFTKGDISEEDFNKLLNFLINDFIKNKEKENKREKEENTKEKFQMDDDDTDDETDTDTNTDTDDEDDRYEKFLKRQRTEYSDEESDDE